ncbi:carbonic anhydrase [Corallococcus sp. AB049A]|uniref:carbonic anhydrase n=1 Tax=Corallococcus sp. AB049A TaxID=2316721 RepID=UPI0034CEECB4
MRECPQNSSSTRASASSSSCARQATSWSPRHRQHIEYGVANLGVRLIVIMGHESCGAVNAGLTIPDGQSTGSPNLDALVSAISCWTPGTWSSGPRRGSSPPRPCPEHTLGHRVLHAVSGLKHVNAPLILERSCPIPSHGSAGAPWP